jgi:hypothetical protein
VVENGAIQNSTITLILPDAFGPPTRAKFFICISNAPEYIDRLVCDSYSPFFGITGITTAVSRNRRGLIKRKESTPTLTAVSSMPTTPLSIIKYTGVVSILNGPPGTISPGVTTTFRPSGTTTITAVPASAPSGSTTRVAHPGELFSGAEAGVSVAVILVALVLLVIILFFRCRN